MSKDKHFSAQLRAQRKGSISVVVALSLLVLVGFCAFGVDYGMLVVDKNRLQRACDAGALAGANYLKLTNDSADRATARTAAVYVAWQNGATINSADITFTNANTQIIVPGRTTRNMLFGRAIGVPTGSVVAVAQADVSTIYNEPVMPPVRVAPIGITWETYNQYVNNGGATLVKLSMVTGKSSALGFENFVLLDLRGPDCKSPAHMMRQLNGTEVEYSAIGELETALNTSDRQQGGMAERAVQDLCAYSQKSPWLDSPYSTAGIRFNQIVAKTSPDTNPRAMTILVTSATAGPMGVNWNITVEGFVRVYMENFEVIKNKNAEICNMYVRFLPSSFTPSTPTVTATPPPYRFVNLVD